MEEGRRQIPHLLARSNSHQSMEGVVRLYRHRAFLDQTLRNYREKLATTLQIVHTYCQEGKSTDLGRWGPK